MSTVVPPRVLRVLLALVVLVTVSGGALALLHTEPNLHFFLILGFHLAFGVSFLLLGIWYLGAHTRRIGTPRWFLVVLAVWLVSLFGIYFAEVPTLAATLINIGGGALLVAIPFAYRRRGQHWSSYLSAALVMLCLGGLVVTGYVMVMPFNSLRSDFYTRTHLLLTPIFPLAIVWHRRARRRGASRVSFRLGRRWWASVAALMLACAAVVQVRWNRIQATIPPPPPARVVSEAIVRGGVDSVSRVGALDPAQLVPPQACGSAARK